MIRSEALWLTVLLVTALAVTALVAARCRAVNSLPAAVSQ
jgi:hypothetical protein